MSITLTNTNAINAELDRAQARCSVRLLTAEDLTAAAAEAERRLTAAGIPQKSWKGTEVTLNPWSVAKSYSAKGTPSGTIAKLTRRATVWELTEVKRGYPAGRADHLVITLPDADPRQLLASMLRKAGLQAA